MIKWHKLIAVFLILFLLVGSLSFADTTNGIDSPGDLIDTDGVPLEIEREANYVFDSDPDLGWMERDFDTEAANVFLSVVRFFVSVTSYVVTFTYTVSIFSFFETLITSIMMPLKMTIYDNFVEVIILLVAVVSIIMYNRGRKFVFYRTMVLSIMIFVMAYAFYMYPLKAVEYTYVVVDELCDSFIENSYSAIFNKELNGRYSGDAALTILNNQLWEAYVGRVWARLEFGEEDLENQYKNQILNLPPGSEVRENLYAEITEKRTKSKPSRAVPMFMYMFITIQLLILTNFIAGIGLTASLIVILLVAVAALVFLMAFFPGRGIRVLFNWMLKILTFSAATFFALVALTTLMAIHIGWLMAASNIGIIIALVLEALMIGVAFALRKWIFGIGKSYRRSGINGIERQIRRGPEVNARIPYGVKNKTHQFAGAAGKRVNDFSRGTTGAAARFMQQMYSEALSDDSTHMQYAYAFANHSMYARNKAKDKVSDAVYSGKEKATDYFDQRTRRQSMAEDYLETRFKVEKAASDDVYDKREEATGEEQERTYPDFVENAMKREAAGMNKFSKEQKRDVVKEMDQLEKIGEDPYKMFTDLKGVLKEQDAVNKPRMQQTFSQMRYKKAMDSVSYDPKKNMMDVPKRANNRTYGEIYLNNQYHLHKSTAESAARTESMVSQKTVKPSYDAFTADVNERMKAGKEKFTKKELDAAERVMGEMREGGINIKDFLNNMQMEDVKEALADQMEVDLDVRKHKNPSESSQNIKEENLSETSSGEQKIKPKVESRSDSIETEMNATVEGKKTEESNQHEKQERKGPVTSSTESTARPKMESQSDSVEAEVNATIRVKTAEEISHENVPQSRPAKHESVKHSYSVNAKDEKNIKSASVNEATEEKRANETDKEKQSYDDKDFSYAGFEYEKLSEEGKDTVVKVTSVNMDEVMKRLDDMKAQINNIKQPEGTKQLEDKEKRSDASDLEKLINRHIVEFKKYGHKDLENQDVLDEIHDKVQDLEYKMGDDFEVRDEEKGKK